MQRITLLFIAILASLQWKSASCQGIGQLSVIAQSTGMASGEIAILTIENATAENQVFSLNGGIIPSIPLQGGKLSQAYIVLPITELTFSPDSGPVKVPVFGYSLDNLRPPAPENMPLPAPATWLDWQEDTQVSILSGFERNSAFAKTAGELLANRLGRNFSITYDIYENPEYVAALLFPLMDGLLKSYQALSVEGVLKSPFRPGSNEEEKQLIQQSLWQYTAQLERRIYSTQQLESGLAQQFADLSGKRIQDADPALKETYFMGIADLWKSSEMLTSVALTSDPGRTKDDASKIDRTEQEVEESPVEPAIDPCTCTGCDLKGPWQFLGIKAVNSSDLPITPVSGKEIPHGVFLHFNTPEFAARCPEDCKSSTNSNWVAEQIRKEKKTIARGLSQGKNFVYIPEGGAFDFKFIYQCHCATESCAPKRETESLTANMGNVCSQDNARALGFVLGNTQSITLSGDSLLIRLLPPLESSGFQLPLHMEAAIRQIEEPVFANLFTPGTKENVIFRKLLDQSPVLDWVAFSDNNSLPPLANFYHILLNLDHTGGDVLLLLSFEADLCTLSAGLVVEDAVPEYGQSIYSPEELYSMLESIEEDKPDHPDYWIEMLFIGFQLTNGLKSDPDSFGTYYRFWKGKCEGTLITLMNKSEKENIRHLARGLVDYSFTNPTPGALLRALGDFIGQFQNQPAG